MFVAVNKDRATILTSCVVFVAVNVDRATVLTSCFVFVAVNVDRATVLNSYVVFVAVNVDSLNTPPHLSIAAFMSRGKASNRTLIKMDQFDECILAF